MPDYQKNVNYVIECLDPNILDKYVGHSCDFEHRKATHKSACNNPKDKTYNLKVYQFIREHGGWKNWTVKVIEEYPCEDEVEATLREQHWFKQISATLNSNVPARTMADYYQEHRDSILDYKKKWQQENRTAIVEQKKIYYQANKVRFAEKNKKYHQENKAAIAEKNKKYREDNAEALAEQQKKYREDNAEAIAEYKKKYREANKAKIKKWWEENKTKVNQKRKEKRESAKKARAAI